MRGREAADGTALGVGRPPATQLAAPAKPRVDSIADRFSQFSGNVVVVRNRSAVAHDDDERLKDVRVLFAHIALEIERRDRR